VLQYVLQCLREMHTDRGCVAVSVAVSVAVCVAVLEREMHIDRGSSGKVYMKESCL